MYMYIMLYSSHTSWANKRLWNGVYAHRCLSMCMCMCMCMCIFRFSEWHTVLVLATVRAHHVHAFPHAFCMLMLNIIHVNIDTHTAQTTHETREMQARAERAEAALAVLQAQIASQEPGHGRHHDSSISPSKSPSHEQYTTRRGWAQHSSSSSASHSRTSSSGTSTSSSRLPSPSSSCTGEQASGAQRPGNSDSDSDSEHSSWSNDADEPAHRRGNAESPRVKSGQKIRAKHRGVGGSYLRESRLVRRSGSEGSCDGVDGHNRQNNEVVATIASDGDDTSDRNQRGDDDREAQQQVQRKVRCRQMLLGSVTVAILSEAVAQWFAPPLALRLRRCRRTFMAFADACERAREERSTERGRELEEQCRQLRGQVDMLTQMRASGAWCPPAHVSMCMCICMFVSFACDMGQFEMLMHVCVLCVPVCVHVYMWSRV
jgi:hypothetical protein